MGLSRTARQLATTEAREKLPRLVSRMRNKKKASKDPLDDAVQIGPHRKGGAVLVPEIDLAAHLDRMAKLKRQVEELEEQVEDLLLAQALDEMYAGRSTVEGKPLDQVIRELGFEEELRDAG